MSVFHQKCTKASDRYTLLLDNIYNENVSFVLSFFHPDVSPITEEKIACHHSWVGQGSGFGNWGVRECNCIIALSTICQENKLSFTSLNKFPANEGKNWDNMMKSGVAILWEIKILQIVIIQNLDCDPLSILFDKEKKPQIMGGFCLPLDSFKNFWQILSLKCVRKNYKTFFKLFHIQK